MRRYNYGQNFTVQNTGLVGGLTLLGTLEVVPGDTVSGRFSNAIWSDTTNRPIMNRTYFDTYAFYIPYRLLWEGFPDFIANTAEAAGDPSIPTVTGLQEYFLEHPTLDATTCTAWNRRAYNLVYNKFFRLAENPVVDEDGVFSAIAATRQTTFHESAYDPGTINDQDVEIDVIGESVSIDALRKGFAEDRYNKIRQYYGDKYVDYLASMGVKASWSIVDDPEPIGKNNKDLPYINTRSTFADPSEEPGDKDVGDSAGYFKGKQVCNIKPTFCPEHGMIVMFGCMRMNLPNVNGSAAPNLSTTQVIEFWSPEFETQRVQLYNDRLWGEDVGGKAVQARAYEHLRKPSNQIGRINTTDPELLYTASRDSSTLTPSDYKLVAPNEYDKLFTGTMGGNQVVHYTAYNEVRMLKKSPVRPPQGILGVS